MTQAQVTIIEGNSFIISNAQGDVVEGTTHGLFHADTRFLSKYVLTMNGQEPLLLSSRPVHHDSASFYLTNHPASAIPQGHLTIIRDRFVDKGLHEDISVTNHGTNPAGVTLDLDFAADFADVFEVRGAERVKDRVVSFATDESGRLSFSYRRAEFTRETLISFSQRPHRLEGGHVQFTLLLGPKEQWHTCLTISLVIDGVASSVDCRVADFDTPGVTFEEKSWGQTGSPPERPDNWLSSVPQLVTDDINLYQAYRRAVSDLAALRLSTATGHYLPAAGLPWYLAIFGRDSIVTGLQTMMLGPTMATNILNCLAQYQSQRLDDFRDEQPGKMPHEIRAGELACLDEVPHSRYYGTVDATPLYLILLSETWRWTGDITLVQRLRPVIEDALKWIDEYGDLDGDGFVEYRRRSLHGLINQGWKDSTDCICFADGRLAQGSIALAEVQGYVYDAKLRMAEIYEQLGDWPRADRLRGKAAQLKARFNEAFWLPSEGYYALALDGDKRPVDAVTSNPGHCLWSGIIAAERAASVVARLMAADMFSGWGIRTMSTLAASYNPVSYHNGSVWPHDNSIICAGFRRYGFHREAAHLAESLFAASAMLPYRRLPELLAGYARRGHGFPVDYPGANAPQAWAAGAIISLLQTILGLEVDGDELRSDPAPGLPAMHLTGIPCRGTCRPVSTASPFAGTRA